MSNVIRCEVKPHRESCRDSCCSKSVPPHSGQASWGTGRSGDVTATSGHGVITRYGRRHRPPGHEARRPRRLALLLKEDYDLGRGHAMALWHVIKNGQGIRTTHVGTTGTRTPDMAPEFVRGQGRVLIS